MRKLIWSEQTFDPKEYLESLGEGDGAERTLVQTMFGVESVIDPFASIHHLKIYICDTNFTISKEVYDTIRVINGVEFLDVLSRYRFIISFGKCFSAQSVKAEIESEILGQNEKTEILGLLNEGYNEHGIDYVLYIRDDRISYTTSEEDDFEVKRELYEESHQKYGGELYKPNQEG